MHVDAYVRKRIEYGFRMDDKYGAFQSDSGHAGSATATGAASGATQGGGGAAGGGAGGAAAAGAPADAAGGSGAAGGGASGAAAAGAPADAAGGSGAAGGSAQPTPHGIKKLVNNISPRGRRHLMVVRGGEVLYVEWEQVEQALDSRGEFMFDLLKWWTLQHLRPSSWDKMNVKLATDMIGNDVSALLETIGDDRHAATREFVIRMREWKEGRGRGGRGREWRRGG